MNAILEGELIVENEHKYGSYPTRKIPRKCMACFGNLMLVTNISANMLVYSSNNVEFQSIGSQTVRVHGSS